MIRTGRPGLRVGAAEAIITPPVGLRLVGPLRRSTGVHDELYVRSIVLGDGTTDAALVFLDLIGLDKPFSDAIRREISARTGIAHVLINCSHTHSAPFTIPWSVEGRQEYEEEAAGWRDELIATVAATVKDAAARRRDTTVRSGKARVQVGINRRFATADGIDMRPNPEGPVVSSVDVLCFDLDDGERKIILASHAAHPVIVHGASTLMSADYPGFAMARIRDRIGGSTLAAFAQGCCGNINGEPLRGGFDAARRAGEDLAEAAVTACSESQPIDPTPMRILTQSVVMPLQDLPTRSECEALLEKQRNLLESSTNDDVAYWYARNNILCVQRLIEVVEGSEQPKGVSFEVNALVLGGDFCLITMTDEVFCDYQLWIKENSPFKNTMVWAYTNGCEIYVPVDSAFQEGGYEAAPSPTLEYASALYYHNRLALAPGVERRIKDTIQGLWGRP